MFELTRATTVGALVDEIHLSEYGLVAFVNGRRFHGLLTLLPMVLGAVLGAAVARRSDRGASPHSGWAGWAPSCAGAPPVSRPSCRWGWPSRSPCRPVASIDWAAAERLAVLPAGGGQRLEFWTATGEDGMTCLTHLLVSEGSPEPAELAESSRALTSGAACAEGAMSDQDFSVSSVARGSANGVLSGSAGEVTRAELRLLDGQVVPLLVQDGWILGSFDGTEVPASVIGYGPDDQRMGTIDLLQQEATID